MLPLTFAPQLPLPLLRTPRAARKGGKKADLLFQAYLIEQAEGNTPLQNFMATHKKRYMCRVRGKLGERSCGLRR
jgi:hypothetical protein